MIRSSLILLVSFQAVLAYAYDPLDASKNVSQNGIKIASERLKVISQNIANANSTGKDSAQDPYRRKMLEVENVYDDNLGVEILRLSRIVADKSPFSYKFEPSHPAANEQGYVKYPNVDINLEMVDAKEAQTAFEANLSALEIAKSNQHKLMEAMK